MNALITAGELDALLKRTTPYSQRELMQLSSFSILPLADKLSDLSYSEKSVVQRLEGVNLYHYTNATMIAIGADERGMSMLQLSPQHAATIDEIKSVSRQEAKDPYMEKELYCLLINKMILSKGDRNMTVKLDGQVPKKLFSFREMTADEWFNGIIDVYTRVVARVLALNGLEEAKRVLFMQCAWHMHRSQPGKYALNSVEAGILLELFRQFVSEFSK